MIGEFLRRVTTALDVNGVSYMLTGSLASSMYGIPRSTNDVDLVIAPSGKQLRSVVQMFQRLGFTVEPEAALEAWRNRTQFNVIDLKDRDFSITEFERRQTHEVEGVRLTLATPEDVILAKLEWAKIGESERQLNDAAGMIKMQSESLDVRYIGHWVERLGLERQWQAARERAV